MNNLEFYSIVGIGKINKDVNGRYFLEIDWEGFFNK